MTSRYYVIFIVLTVAIVAGCDLFQTRDPAAPTQGTSSRETPTTHDIVLSNLRNAIAEKNVENYMSCFVDPALRPYVFEPSPDQAANFTLWGLESERRYFQNITSSLNGRPSFTDSIYNSTISSSLVTYYMTYTLFIPHQDPNAPRLVQGTMELYFVQDSLHLWSIYKWVDRKTRLDSTWSYLKAWFNR